MSPTELRQKLHQQIDQLPLEWLGLVAEFVAFLWFRQSNQSESPVLAEFRDDSSVGLSVHPSGVQPPSHDRGEQASTGADLLRFVGTWQGDDFEECLQEVYAQRSVSEF